MEKRGKETVPYEKGKLKVTHFVHHNNCIVNIGFQMPLIKKPQLSLQG